MNSHRAYCIPSECGLVYIGETGRNLSNRLKEHKTNCEKAELDKSAVAKHAWTYDHCIEWDEANILAIDSHRFSHKMRESIEIEKHNMIHQEGKPLDSTWRAPFNVHSLTCKINITCLACTRQLITITSLHLQ